MNWTDTGLLLSKNLYKLFPNDKEGDLDKKLSSLVNKKRCVEISNYLSLKLSLIHI